MRRCRIGIGLALLSVVAIGISGCSLGATSQRGGVEGTVTWNGQPIEEGTIVFIRPSENRDLHESRVSAAIHAGTYSLDSEEGPLIGLNKVQVVATRRTGESIVLVNRPSKDEDSEPEATGPSRKVEVLEQYIPSQFNENSSLSADIQPGENEFDFKLTGEARAIRIVPQ